MEGRKRIKEFLPLKEGGGRERTGMGEREGGEGPAAGDIDPRGLRG